MFEHNPFHPFAHDGLERAALDASVRWSQPPELIRFLLMAAVRHMPASVRPWREVVMLGGPGDQSTAIVALNDWAEPPRLLRYGPAIYELTRVGPPGSREREQIIYVYTADSEADTDPELELIPGDGGGGDPDDSTRQWLGDTGPVALP